MQNLKWEEKINAVKSLKEIEKVRVELLGRKGLINQLFEKIKDQPTEERKKCGQQLNQLKGEIEKAIAKKIKDLKPSEQFNNLAIQQFNNYFSLKKLGHLHPITLVENELNALFKKLGFSVHEGPEIETDEFCFQRLNVPLDHPARDLQDTIYIKEPDVLLTSQTSSIEARLLSNEKPPFKTAFPGTTYRNEKVTKTNHFVFHQYQCVAVDKDLTLKDLIGTTDYLFKNMYGKDAIVRYRCKYYPEVEPGMGLDLQCFNCLGKGCPTCKGIGWIEMGGAGIIHPMVLKMAGIDPKVWRGFAFGLGLDRWVMAKFNIKDIRTLMGGNLAYKPNN